MVLRCTLLIVLSASSLACRVDERDEVMGAERSRREVPYPERLYMPREPPPERAAQERAGAAPTLHDLDAGAPDGTADARP
jgi:hypothetical protein